MNMVPGFGELCIVEATIDDLDELQTIENKTFSAPWSRKAFEAELIGNEFSLILTARCRDSAQFADSESFVSTQKLVGYICIWIVFEELRFMNLAVEPEVRRQGIGAELIKKALQIGLTRGVQRALLEVRESNDAAQALYMHFGFESYGKRLRYYTNPTENAMLMALEPIVIPVTQS